MSNSDIKSKIEDMASAPAGLWWPHGTQRGAAMALYSPPFRFESGYIYDSENNMVVDDGDLANASNSVAGAVAARVRGWGRIGKLDNAEALQDEVGRIVAEALNEFYVSRQSGQSNLKTLDPSEIESILVNAGTTGKHQAWFTRKEAVRAVLAAVKMVSPNGLTSQDIAAAYEKGFADAQAVKEGRLADRDFSLSQPWLVTSTVASK